MRKIDFEVDSDTKNMIINGDRGALVAVIDTLRSLSDRKEFMADHLKHYHNKHPKYSKKAINSFIHLLSLLKRKNQRNNRRKYKKM
jgi:hypothetical protein